MIVNSEQIKFVKLNLLFKDVPRSNFESLIKSKNFQKYSDGTIIYQHGDETLELYLIVKGEVKMKYPITSTAIQKYLLDFFGEKEIVDNTPRKSIAIADQDCILYKISIKELKILIQQNNAIYKNLKKSDIFKLQEQQTQTSSSTVPQTSEIVSSSDNPV